MNMTGNPAVNPWLQAIINNMDGDLPSDPYEIRALEGGLALELGRLTLAINRSEVEADVQTWGAERVSDALNARASPGELVYDVEPFWRSHWWHSLHTDSLTALQMIPLLATVPPGKQALLLDGGLRFRLRRNFGVQPYLGKQTYAVKVVDWSDVLRFTLTPPKRADRATILDRVFRFLKFSLNAGRQGVIGHNIPDAGQAAAVMGTIRASVTNKARPEALERLRQHGIVNLMRIIHFEHALRPNRPLSDEAQFENISWPDPPIGEFPMKNFNQMKNNHVADAVKTVLGVPNLPSARKQFNSEVVGSADVRETLLRAKRWQYHLSVAYEVIRTGEEAALKAYNAERGHHEGFDELKKALMTKAKFYETRKDASVEGLFRNPHFSHDHFWQQYKMLQAAELKPADFRRLARDVGVSLGAYLGREARDQCLLEWFAKVSCASDLAEIEIEPMAAHRYLMRRRMATLGADHYSVGWDELFEFITTRFDIATLDKRCYMFAKNTNKLWF
jgi:hypothetical protein